MTHRYCSDCDHWYSYDEYNVSASSELLCPKGHGELHGTLTATMQTVTDLLRENGLSHTSFSKEADAAVRQGLVSDDTEDDPWDLFN